MSTIVAVLRTGNLDVTLQPENPTARLPIVPSLQAAKPSINFWIMGGRRVENNLTGAGIPGTPRAARDLLPCFWTGLCWKIPV